MAYHDSIDVSKGIDVNKSSLPKEYIICHYWYFLGKGFQSSVYNSCHDILMLFFWH